jgi:tRNA A37 threonylcarbamoyladenosine dehydratase
MSDFDLRFGGIARLFGAEGLARLRSAHVCVVGLGGVGSWTVEALARSGVGALTLVDLDEVCVSNVNRQLHALDGAAGRPKADVLGDRLRAIHPECRVTPVVKFFTEATAGEILAPKFDAVVDAIDAVSNKARLIAMCRQRNLVVVTTGGAGGRRDPTAIRVADLARTAHDRLLQKVREQLRREHGFPRSDGPFGVPCVYSPEAQVFPRKDGSVCAERPADAGRGELHLTCDTGFGSAAFVTGAFGFAAAAEVVKRIVNAG